MNIRISGQQIDLGPSLQEYAQSRLDEVVRKYMGRFVEASVAFKREGDGFRTDIVVHANGRTSVNASADSADIYRSFDDALSRVAKRLRRHKRWLVEHRSGGPTEAAASAEASRPAGRHALLQWDGERLDEAPQESVVIAELDTPVETVTVADAVHLLDLGEEMVLMFRNAGTGSVNVVYRRCDGNIGWIEP